jgi:hypothetical protein
MAPFSFFPALGCQQCSWSVGIVVASARECTQHCIPFLLPLIQPNTALLLLFDLPTQRIYQLYLLGLARLAVTRETLVQKPQVNTPSQNTAQSLLLPTNPTVIPPVQTAQTSNRPIRQTKHGMRVPPLCIFTHCDAGRPATGTGSPQLTTPEGSALPHPIWPPSSIWGA